MPRPEHLVAMKVQAMRNDPSRALQDLAGVLALLQLPGALEPPREALRRRRGPAGPEPFRL